MWRRIKPPFAIAALFYALVMLWTNLAWGACNSINCATAAGQCVAVADAANLDITGPFTLAAWIKTSTAAEQGIIGHGGAFSGHFTVGFGFLVGCATCGGDNNTTKLTGYTCDGTACTDVVGGTAVNDGAWHHVAYTYDGAQGCVYLDGASDGCAANTRNPANPVGSQLKIGSRVDGFSTLQGTIADARIYNVALSQPDLALIAAGGDVTANEVSRWPMTEGTGATFADCVDGNTANLETGTTWSATNPGVACDCPGLTPTPTNVPGATETPTPADTVTPTITPTTTVTPTFLANDTCCQYDIPLCAPPSGVTGQCDGFPNGVAVPHAACINFIECMPFTPTPTVTRTTTTTPTPVVTPTAPTATFTVTPSETPTPSPTLAPGDCCSCTNFTFCSQGNCDVLCPDGTPPVPHAGEICVDNVGCSTPTAGASPTSTVTPTATVANTPIPNRCCIVPLFSGTACVADIWGDCGAAEGAFGPAIPTPIDGGSCAGTFPSMLCATLTPFQSPTPSPTPTQTLRAQDCCDCSTFAQCTEGNCDVLCPDGTPPVIHPDQVCFPAALPGDGNCVTPTATQTATITPTGHMACLTPTPTETVTPTPSPMHCKTFTPAPPTATPTGCPYTFLDHTGDLGASCLYTGSYDQLHLCHNVKVPMDGTFFGDGENVTIVFSSYPTITWMGTATSSGIAALTRMRLGTGRVVPFDGTAILLGRTQLQVTPASQQSLPPLSMCAYNRNCTADEDCDFTQYLGNFDQTIDATHPPPTRTTIPFVHQTGQ